MKFDILTLFPEMFESFKNTSIIGRAIKNKIIDVNTINFRDYSTNKHRKVDDYTYGGGAGMLLSPQPIIDSLRAIDYENTRVIYLSPKGKTFNQNYAKEFSKLDRIILLCGHYEGVDQRVIDNYVTDEISIGDFVLTGGEIPAMMVVDSISRMIDGVLSSNVSFEDESFYSGVLEYPQYTRPSTFEGVKVPDVLLSGNHEKIKEWRLIESLKVTKKRRKDLFNKFAIDNKKNKYIKKILDDL
ncbi:tRNA (guanosine(37)-N1)-methyltransferase TrmD [Helicovermis profundi]|uniref:tRNA (guanine-N(1)-)-methyltransferase n=1 Tax=Helicovermis profundi TaxID=3065157 RepID=A0AAU9EBT7_9FIRM|nr:tRNA (guanosine(37)-N1)-methyltransferase TrmD [Clostridia bacterium S502]